jgi:hypothetical protein
MTESEFSTIKSMMKLYPTSRIMQLTSRSSATMSLIGRSKDYEEYKYFTKIYNAKKKPAPTTPATAETAPLSANQTMPEDVAETLNRIDRRLANIELIITNQTTSIATVKMTDSLTKPQTRWFRNAK